MSRFVTLLAIFWLAGCSQVVWLGHDPLRRKSVVVLEDRDGQTVYVDGRAHATFDGIGLDGLVFSDDGERLIYPARRGEFWALVIDGVESRSWDGIGEVVVSPRGNHIAYAATDNGAWRVVVDHVAQQPFSAIMRGSLVMSANGLDVAYVAKRAGKMHVVHNGELAAANSDA